MGLHLKLKSIFVWINVTADIRNFFHPGFNILILNFNKQFIDDVRAADENQGMFLNPKIYLVSNFWKK